MRHCQSSAEEAPKGSRQQQGRSSEDASRHLLHHRPDAGRRSHPEEGPRDRGRKQAAHGLRPHSIRAVRGAVSEPKTGRGKEEDTRGSAFPPLPTPRL